MSAWRPEIRMRKFATWIALTAALVVLAACVTINVYFPEAAAEKAAQQFVDKVIGPPVKDSAPPPSESQPDTPPGKSPGAMLLDFVIPSAHAQQPDISVHSPQIEAIQARMRQRFEATLHKYFSEGAIGFSNDGLVAMRDASVVPIAERAKVNVAIADENRDRKAVYREIAVANGHPEWEAQIRQAFAKQWIERAQAGWYYQDAGGAWKRK